VTQPSDDWSDLSRAWTDPASDAPQDLRADAALIRSVQRRDRLARLNFWAELGGGVIVLGVVVWAAVVHDLPWSVNVAALAFIVFGVALTVWSRRGDPGVLTETPEAVLRSAIAQARTGERWAWAGVAMSVAAFAFLGVMRGVGSARDGFDLIPALVIFLLVCIAGYGCHARRCRRRRRAHEAALAALDEIGTDGD
jgi:Na+/melibiose symporter-like transporter